ncbi:DUF1097 domain-containing protein [Variovorax sp. J31P207]|uniref:DUF1097 domain-containing protein n=1 Tax=Variovorax sp. J31P207 TaxID=3053510 RepID=UPI002578D23F|nr:DUF1097 domain-containing protein [Variovorax sp. J31P207]MDM0071624.1 DUF1097 domain-containing protein [Variovorax sp. J31P207]
MSNSTAGAIAPLSIKFNALTLVAATTAAIAASTSASLGWSVWAMFVGWVAFFTRGHSARDALFSYLCLAIGIAFGTVAALAVGALLPLMGPLAFAPVVFVVAMVVVSLRAAAPLNNIPAYFLGLITFFAAHLPPSLLAFGELAAVSALGTLAAWLAHRWQTRILQK